MMSLRLNKTCNQTGGVAMSIRIPTCIRASFDRRERVNPIRQSRIGNETIAHATHEGIMKKRRSTMDRLSGAVIPVRRPALGRARSINKTRVI